ncbi:hypothetical protein BD310DRAFT_1017265 [Dichomitus squalens]|uniref:Uncharacterized protein n=1 Tax=Dichomitus squalens TaxID=114155 RepID=A0A4Q9PU37_9APHY|nr:hypothetical protein BD310DRAFT_1017265 [Dichomitus squalens]
MLLERRRTCDRGGSLTSYGMPISIIQNQRAQEIEGPSKGTSRRRSENAHESPRGNVYCANPRKIGSAWQQHSSSRTSSSKAEFSEGVSYLHIFDFDTNAVERLARSAEKAALQQIDRKQAEALKSKSNSGCYRLRRRIPPAARLLHHSPVLPQSQ